MAVEEVLVAHTKLNQNGRIVIPAAQREQMGIKPGDDLVLTLENGVLNIETHRAVIRKIQEDFRKYRKPGVSSVDAFIAERHEEARREQEEGLA